MCWDEYAESTLAVSIVLLCSCKSHIICTEESPLFLPHYLEQIQEPECLDEQTSVMRVPSFTQLKSELHKSQCFTSYLTHSMTYGARRLNATFTI